MVALVSLCRAPTSTSTLALSSAALLARARLFSGPSSTSSPSSSPPPSPPPRRRSKAASGSSKEKPLLLSGAARRSLGLYRSALRAARLQPTPEARDALTKTARSLMERNMKVDSQTAEHLQRRGARQLELLRLGAAVLGTVRV